MNPSELRIPNKKTPKTFQLSMMRKTIRKGRGPMRTLIIALTGRTIIVSRNTLIPSNWISEVTFEEERA